MRTYVLPGGEAVDVNDIIRVFPPSFDWGKWWEKPLYNLFKGNECHFFEVEIKPARIVRIYSDKEMMRYRTLMHFIGEEEREEIVY